MERLANIEVTSWRRPRILHWPNTDTRARFVVLLLATSALLSAAFATLLPLQFSVITVFLFAGPHNLLEFRYFVRRLPVRLGKSRTFFLVAFCGLFFLVIAYLSLPALYYAGLWSGINWITVIGGWNTLLLLWLATLVWLRGKQRKSRDWSWAWPVAFGLTSANWLAPELFSLALVYLHPLIALWFLERELRRTRPEWLAPYHRMLAAIPIVVAIMCVMLWNTASLAEDNGLAWRITQHAGAELLSGVSSHMLVSVHVFLEMLHYFVWILVLPLLGATGGVFDLKKLPLVTHPHGFPRLIALTMMVAVFMVGLLWLGFSLDYSLTRDLYFAVAMTHVLAEAPFLLRTM
jgi:hypothetical protein